MYVSSVKGAIALGRQPISIRVNQGKVCKLQGHHMSVSQSLPIPLHSFVIQAERSGAPQRISSKTHLKEYEGYLIRTPRYRLERRTQVLPRIMS